MLPGSEPFLAAICAAPDDDLSRLVFADWLDENGDPDRAEFIRVQCELAGLGHPFPPVVVRRKNTPAPAPDPADRPAFLAHRNAELWAAHGDAWRAELPECVGSTLRFGRGFAGWADVSHPGGLARDGDRLMALAPITWVSFRDCPAFQLREPVKRCPWFARVRKLSVAYRPGYGEGGDDVAESLAESPHTGGLGELLMANTDLGDAGLFALCKSGRAGQLQRADLSVNRIGSA
ncbi:MAG: TIGR02996 domain-containing protein, partial [Fimbriiglobus sp.]